MSKRILVVEDESAIADTITYALKTEGMDVAWCQTAETAIDHLGRREPDLILLDVGLPDVCGFDLCREIRKSSHVPIIFLTARSDEIDRVVGLEIGADDYVCKPFSPRELAARVKAVLRRHPRSEKSPQLSAEFELDPARRAIRYHGQALDLSRYEYLLLEHLLKRPGWVYSRQKLMDHVWDDPMFSTERTVDTHIKTIRSKLKAIRSQLEIQIDLDPIQTHRGMGYSVRTSA